MPEDGVPEAAPTPNEVLSAGRVLAVTMAAVALLSFLFLL
jgi:hypothetical protein